MTSLRFGGIVSFVFTTLLVCSATGDEKQHERPFDRYRAIFAVGVGTLNVTWTSEARQYVLDEVKRRGEKEKLIVCTDSNVPTEKFRADHALTTDQVIWLVMTFDDQSKTEAGRVSFTINVNNGSYLQGAIFDPGVTFATAKPTLDRMLNGFFEFGEGKVTPR
jgi:hypothetical protein